MQPVRKVLTGSIDGKNISTTAISTRTTNSVSTSASGLIRTVPGNRQPIESIAFIKGLRINHKSFRAGKKMHFIWQVSHRVVY